MSYRIVEKKVVKVISVADAVETMEAITKANEAGKKFYLKPEQSEIWIDEEIKISAELLPIFEAMSTELEYWKRKAPRYGAEKREKATTSSVDRVESLLNQLNTAFKQDTGKKYTDAPSDFAKFVIEAKNQKTGEPRFDKVADLEHLRNLSAPAKITRVFLEAYDALQGSKKNKAETAEEKADLLS